MEAMTWFDTAWRVILTGFLAVSPGVAILLLGTAFYLLVRPLIRKVVPTDGDGTAASAAHQETEISCRW